jgi:DNA-binding MarR family transcriptional regulator
MSSRKQYIAAIMESMHAVRRALILRHASKFSLGKHEKMSITPSQWAVLSIVMEKGTTGVKELARSLGITSSATTQLVDGLVARGYLVRKSNVHDRRALSLELSEKKKKEMGALKKHMMGHFAAMFEALDDKELAHYARLNKKIVEHILKKKR